MTFGVTLKSLSLCLLLVFANIGFALCVTSSGTNMREGPGTNYPITWQVSRFTPLLEVERKGGWYKVRDMDGDVHWIYRTLVTNSIQCLSIRASAASLRTGPGTQHSYAELPSVGKYYPFKKIDFNPPWYRIQDDKGGKYWVHESLVWRPMKRQTISF